MENTENQYIKHFDVWNESKKTLDSQEFTGFFHEREVWWCALGVNIGSEQDGKNENFERPVLIIKKIFPSLLLIVPLTSKITSHEDRITINVAGSDSQVLLTQLRVISSKRLLRIISKIKEKYFEKIILEIIRFLVT